MDLTWQEMVEQAVSARAVRRARGERAAINATPNQISRWQRGEGLPRTEMSVRQWFGALGLDADAASRAWRAAGGGGGPVCPVCGRSA